MDGGEERKEKKDVRKEEKIKEGKGTKKELCKVKNSSLFLSCSIPAVREENSPFGMSEFRGSLLFVDPVQDPGIKDALFQEECRQDPDFLNQVLVLKRMLRVETRTESASLSALSVPVVSLARSLDVSLARSGVGENSLEEHESDISGNVDPGASASRAGTFAGVQRVHSR